MTLPTRNEQSTSEAADLAAALAGDAEAFRRLTERYTRELHVHCYRLLGSFEDAEDALQETWVRAWRHLPGFQERSSLRAWLYRIATNVCLTGRARRPVTLPPAPPALADALAQSAEPAVNYGPYPDALLDELEASWGNPATSYDLQESVQLAFLAAIQLLPPRQRAVLILCDVLDWSASEVADLLASSTASVNSALQRARATLAQQREAGRLQTERIQPTDAVAGSLVERYIEAWNAVDVDGLAKLLKADAVLTMPPWPLRYEGREAVAEFFRTIPAGGALDQFRLVPARANRQPALGIYRFQPADGGYRAFVLMVLTLDGDAIAELTVFHAPEIFSRFGLAMRIDDRDEPGNDAAS